MIWDDGTLTYDNICQYCVFNYVHYLPFLEQDSLSLLFFQRPPISSLFFFTSSSISKRLNKPLKFVTITGVLSQPRLAADPCNRLAPNSHVDGVFVRRRETVLQCETVLQRQDQSRNLSNKGAARFMKRHSRDAEANKTTSMKVQYDGNLGVRRNNQGPVDLEEGAGCGVERQVGK